MSNVYESLVAALRMYGKDDELGRWHELHCRSSVLCGCRECKATGANDDRCSDRCKAARAALDGVQAKP